MNLKSLKEFKNKLFLLWKCILFLSNFFLNDKKTFSIFVQVFGLFCYYLQKQDFFCNEMKTFQKQLLFSRTFSPPLTGMQTLIKSNYHKKLFSVFLFFVFLFFSFSVFTFPHSTLPSIPSHPKQHDDRSN